MVQMLLLLSFIYSISCLVKNCMNYNGVCKFFYKKETLKKQHIYRNKKLSIVYYYDVIIQASKLFIFRDLLNFTTKWCTGGKLRPLVLFFVLLVIQKVQKLEGANIQSDWKTTNKKRTDSSYVFTCSGKAQKGGERYTEWLRNNK